MPALPDAQPSQEHPAAIIHKLRGPLSAISALAETLAEGILGPLSRPQAEAISSLREELVQHLHQIESLEELWMPREATEEPPTPASALPRLVHSILSRFSSTLEDRQLHLRLDETISLPEISPSSPALQRLLHRLITCQIALVPKDTSLLLHFSLMSEQASPLAGHPAIQTQLIRLEPLDLLLLQRAGDLLVDHSNPQAPALGIRLPDGWTCWIGTQPSPAPVTQSAAPSQTNESSSRPLILLADDQAALSTVLANYLEDLGFEVEKASDGLAVVRKARESLPSLILMDLRMPLLSGIDALHQIRHADDPAVQAIPVVCMSGFSTAEEEARCLAAGAQAFLRKPFRPADLVGLLLTACPLVAKVIR